MEALDVEPNRIRAAWAGRVSGCQLGKPVELLSMLKGRQALADYLAQAQATPLRDYIPLLPDTIVEKTGAASCRGRIVRSEPDDDINYTFLCLLMLEQHGLLLTKADVARTWLKKLPAGATFTAEFAAYRTLLQHCAEHFAVGADPGFDLDLCSENAYNEWIGAQIRTDLYGWVCPGRPRQAAKLARIDASLSHRGDGVEGAAFVAALGAAIPACDDLHQAVEVARGELPVRSGALEAVDFGLSRVGHPNAIDQLHERYADLSPVHTLNNLAVVVWALIASDGDFSRGIGESVAAGWDTDCNGATVGGLLGLSLGEIPESWTAPWSGRIGLSLAGYDEVRLDEVVERTVAVADSIR